MSTISAAHARAFWLLRNEIYTKLDEAEFHADEFEDWDDKERESASKLICDLATVIRTVVARHEEDAEGRCVFCHHSWPCLSIGSIHQMMRDPEREYGKLLNALP